MKNMMKVIMIIMILSFNLTSGSTMKNQELVVETKKEFNIDNLPIIDIDLKLYKETDVELCYVGYSSKSYMSYKAITSKSSEQYKFIKSEMNIDKSTGYLRWNDDDRFIGIALGSAFGEIGSLWKFVFENGQELYAVKIEMKADDHTVNGCRHKKDYSIIEFVIDRNIAEQAYGKPLSYSKLWSGNIVEIYRMEVNR